MTVYKDCCTELHNVKFEVIQHSSYITQNNRMVNESENMLNLMVMVSYKNLTFIDFID